MKESGFYDFTEDLLEPELEVPASPGTYFNVLQDLQDSLNDSEIDLIVAESNEQRISAPIADDDLSFDLESDETDLFLDSPDSDLQLSHLLDDEFETDFESLVELPEKIQAAQFETPFSEKELNGAENDSVTQQFQEFLREQAIEIEKPEKPVVGEVEDQLTLNEKPLLFADGDDFLFLADDALPVPETLGNFELNDSSFAEFESSDETFDLIVTDEDDLTGIEEFASKETFAENSFDVESELPEFSSVIFDSATSSVESPDELFSDDLFDENLVLDDLKKFDLNAAENAEENFPTISEVKEANDLFEAEADALATIDFDESQNLELPSGENEFDEEFEAFAPEVIFAHEDVTTEFVPEPPSFLFAAEENFPASSALNSQSSPSLELYEETNAEILNQYVVFKLDEQLFAFPASCIDEIGHPLPVTNLPFVPAWFSGVASLRGDIIAVLDLRLLWKKQPAPSEMRTKMLVLRSNRENLRVGLLVDGINELLPLAPDQIKSPADFSELQFSDYLIGVSHVHGQQLLLLDSEQFLNSPQIRQI